MGFQHTALPALMLLSALLCSCAETTTVRVDSHVPSALVRTLPLTVGVYYDEELRNHHYIEDSPERPNWDIESGNSQVALFDQVLTSTFERVVAVPRIPDAGAPAACDLVVAPEIVEMQFATPEETFFEFYEAWIRYRIEMFTPTGDPIDNWEVTAYGKSPEKRFSGRATGLNNAVELALRDIGAKLSTGMRDQAAVKELLTQGR